MMDEPTSLSIMRVGLLKVVNEFETLPSIKVRVITLRCWALQETSG